jgi:hypothetical protein
LYAPEAQVAATGLSAYPLTLAVLLQLLLTLLLRLCQLLLCL